jgi:hypothetical protein
MRRPGRSAPAVYLAASVRSAISDCAGSDAVRTCRTADRQTNDRQNQRSPKPTIAKTNDRQNQRSSFPRKRESIVLYERHWAPHFAGMTPMVATVKAAALPQPIHRFPAFFPRFAPSIVLISPLSISRFTSSAPPTSTPLTNTIGNVGHPVHILSAVRRFHEPK